MCCVGWGEGGEGGASGYRLIRCRSSWAGSREVVRKCTCWVMCSKDVGVWPLQGPHIVQYGDRVDAAHPHMHTYTFIPNTQIYKSTEGNKTFFLLLYLSYTP